MRWSLAILVSKARIHSASLGHIWSPLTGRLSSPVHAINHSCRDSTSGTMVPVSDGSSTTGTSGISTARHSLVSAASISPIGNCRHTDQSGHDQGVLCQQSVLKVDVKARLLASSGLHLNLTKAQQYWSDYLVSCGQLFRCHIYMARAWNVVVHGCLVTLIPLVCNADGHKWQSQHRVVMEITILMHNKSAVH